MNIENKAREIICRYLHVEPEQVKMETVFIDDLKVDSMSLIELALAIEEEFDIEVSDEDTSEIRNLKDIVEYVSGKTSSS